MGFDELVQHDASELTKGTLPAERLPSEGVDADTLDGVDGSSYARLDQNETVTGEWVFNTGGANLVTTFKSADFSALIRVLDDNAGFNLQTNSGDFRVDTNIGSGSITQNAIYADTNGNVGIGTTSPSEKQEVAGVEPTIRVTNTKSDYGDSATQDVAHGALDFYLEESSGDGPGVHAAVRAMNEGDFADRLGLGFFTRTASPATERVRIKSDGNVGIGTTSPVNTLDVSGAAVIGSGFAGINTAPTDGLLVEGRTQIGNASKSVNRSVLDYDMEIRRGSGKATLLLQGTKSAGVQLTDSNAAADTKSWIFGTSGNAVFFQALNDDGTFDTRKTLTVNRSEQVGVGLLPGGIEFSFHHAGGNIAHLGCPTAGSLTTANMDNGSVSFEVDETNNELDVTVKKSGGTVVTGTVALS